MVPLLVGQGIPWPSRAGVSYFIPSNPTPVGPVYDPNVLILPFIRVASAFSRMSDESIDKIVALPSQLESFAVHIRSPMVLIFMILRC